MTPGSSSNNVEDTLPTMLGCFLGKTAVPEAELPTPLTYPFLWDGFHISSDTILDLPIHPSFIPCNKFFRVYLVLDDLRDAEVDEVSASDMIPRSGSKSDALRPTTRLQLPPEDDGFWFGDVRGLARRPS